MTDKSAIHNIRKVYYREYEIVEGDACGWYFRKKGENTNGTRGLGDWRDTLQACIDCIDELEDGI